MLILRKPALTRYGSFLPPLRAICAIVKPKTIIEFGPGYISTQYFLSLDAKVISFEMCSVEWYEMLKLHYRKNPLLDLRLVNSEAYNSIHSENLSADIGFIDGHPDTRRECLIALLGICPIIIAHDFDLDGNEYQDVDVTDTHRFFLFDKISPHTGIWVCRKHDMSLTLHKALMDVTL